MLSTYAPTRCGLASFSASLCNGLESHGAAVDVVRIADGDPPVDPRVVGELAAGSSASVAVSADLLSRCDIAVIQYDVDAYGGTDGSDVLEVMRALRVPAVVVAHAVPSHAAAGRRAVFEAVLDLADKVVVMSDAVGEHLTTGYPLHRAKLATIAHGATIPTAASAKRGGRPTILTWGLLRPGKGVERVIDAMGSLQELRGQPRYVIAGVTHPAELASNGESYREGLEEQVRQNGLTGSVLFDHNYRGPGSLSALIQSCAVVVLPYDSTDQVTSGVLTDAVACGRPVVATAFPHAVDLLGCGAGTVVAHDDPEALTAALRQVLSDPRLSGSMAAEGRRLAPTLAWPAVAEAYLVMANRLMSERRALT